MNLKWSSKYSCNNKVIDSQHEKLFELGYKLDTLIKKNDENDKFDEIISVYEELTQYALYHFKTEEKLMLDTDYPEYSLHKEEHCKFVSKLSEFDITTVDKDQTKALKELLMFVGKWIISHIFSTDMKYMNHFSEHGLE